MKTISYVALTAWICIAATLYGTMHVMNKIRIQDSTEAASENLNRLVEISGLIESGDVTAAGDSIERFIEFQLSVARLCDYNECISPVKDHVKDAIDHASQYMSVKKKP